MLIYFITGGFRSSRTKCHNLHLVCLFALIVYIQCGLLDPSGSIRQLWSLRANSEDDEDKKTKSTFDLLAKQEQSSFCAFNRFASV